MHPLIIILLTTQLALAQEYTLTPLISGESTEPVAINESGQVVGQTKSKPFLWTKDKGFRTIAGPMLSGSALDINDSGKVVGRRTLIPLKDEPFIWDPKKGTATLPLPPNAPNGRAMGINNSDQVVGWAGLHYYMDGTAVIWDGGSVSKIGPTGPSSVAHDINDAGVVVGMEGEYFLNEAFRWEKGKYEKLGTLYRDGGSVAQSINSGGTIVGQSMHPFFISGIFYASRAFLLDQLKMKDTGFVSCPIDEIGTATAYGINSLGQIVGKSGCIHVYEDSISSSTRAAIYDPLTRRWSYLQDLVKGYAGEILDVALAINNKGQIVGTGRDKLGNIVGYLLDPL